MSGHAIALATKGIIYCIKGARSRKCYALPLNMSVKKINPIKITLKVCKGEV